MEKLFESLYEKLGKNFFLGCFIISIICNAYLFSKFNDATKANIELSAKKEEEKQAINDRFIAYFIDKEKEIIKVSEAAKSVENEAIKLKYSLKKIKKDLE